MAQKWLVEFTVADEWIADGFDITDHRACLMLQNELGYARLDEITAEVKASPSRETIEGLQNGSIQPKDEYPVT